MYIHVNDKNEIISYILVGDAPTTDTEHWFEVDKNTIPSHILNDLRSYKYENGKFILRDDILEKRVVAVKTAKIDAMSGICKRVITRGFDHSDGNHYSLNESDQLKLQNLSIKASMGCVTSWHCDDGVCQFYEPDKMLELTSHAELHIAYHHTYFNQLKFQINQMTSIDDIVSVSYGMKLDDRYSAQLTLHTNGYVPADEELGTDIVDTTDYDYIISNANTTPYYRLK